MLTVLLECKTEKRNSQCEHGQPKLVFHVRLTCGPLSIATPVPLLANKFDVRSVLHGQASLAAVNQIYVIHEATNGCKKSNDSLKACFENVNIATLPKVLVGFL